MNVLRVGLKEAKHQVAAVEAALKAGHPPAGSRYHGEGATATAARALKISATSLHSRVGTPTRPGIFFRKFKLKVNWNLYKGPSLEEVSFKAKALSDTPEGKKIRALQDENVKLKSSIKQLQKHESAQEFVANVIGVVLDTPCKPPEWVVKPLIKRGRPDAEVPMTIWSDWHVGQVTKPEDVNYANAYDMDAADRRVRNLVENIINLSFGHHSGNYPGIIINLLGDLISGSIHLELEKTNEQPIQGQLLRVFGLLVWAIRSLRDRFGKVFVVCSSGNHGRGTRKPELSQYVFENWDWFIYKLLALHFESDARVQFSIPASNDNYYSVFGLRFFASHGDMLGARGGDGIIGAIGPIMRGEYKTGRQASSFGTDYDYLLAGHWHQELWLPRAIIANSLCGFDNFAHKFLRAAPSRPSQPLWFVHPKHGITARWNVLVERSEARPGEWVQLWQKSGT